MKFYFDNEALNLNHVPEIDEIREFQQFVDYYNVGYANFVVSKNYIEPGVYVIETSKLTHQWTGDISSDHSFNLIQEIPEHVITAVQHKKLRIVIISVVEGDHYVKDHCDGFRNLTDNIKSKNLPQFSVLIMSGNVKANQEYKKWCEDNKEEMIIEFIGASEGPTNIPNVNSPTCLSACLDDGSKLFNSLNRASRQHRSEHLFYLADRQILNFGLVSGVNFTDYRSKFLEISDDVWNNTLIQNYPRSVDLNVEKLKNHNPANDINIEIYYRSLLSVVTETYFEEPGLFFSEKIFKPLLVGSPQITLSQPGAIMYMLEKFNLNLNFPGIDTNFDSIENSKERFIAFHECLLSWIRLDKSKKIKLIYQWNDQLSHNMNVAKNLNFKKIIVDDIIKSTCLYFEGAQN